MSVFRPPSLGFSVRVSGFLALSATVLTLTAGCTNSGPSAPSRGQRAAPQEQPLSQQEDHAHRPGSHGGFVVTIGRENYHAEFLFEKGGVLRLYLLGQDEAKVQDVESQSLTAYGKAEGDPESVPFVLRPEPQAGDAPGKTSQFLGRLPASLQGKVPQITIPSVRIAGDRYRLAFAPPGEGHEEMMPAKVVDEEERKLYLTPGGKYTEADIRANGGRTASQKYRGFRAAHNLRPGDGDRLCPVTRTKANPRCTWVIAGKTYEFCCPPCIDEFVKLAKERPDELKDPEAYVKRPAASGTADPRPGATSAQ
jgi:hypothetical protein